MGNLNAMSDDPIPAPPDPMPEPANSSSSRAVSSALLGAVAVAAWAWTCVKAFTLHNDLTDIADSYIIDASAIQISQLADQSQLELMPYLAASFGLTTLFLVDLGYALLIARK